MAKTIWIARDKSGDLYLYSKKPRMVQDRAFDLGDDSEQIFKKAFYYAYIKLDSNWYPEITFENSPKELVIKD